MIFLVSGATRALRRLQGHPNFGRLKTPRGGNSVDVIASSGQPWACDNDAFSAWCPDRFRRMLGQVASADRTRLLWVACPDVVADARATLARFGEWEPEVAGLGLPVAFVGQDGAEDMEFPWDRFAALFLGGSTRWKLSAAAEELAREAKARGKWVHMGRVNSARRIRHAIEIGCDSSDGTYASRWPDSFLPLALGCLRDVERQPMLKGWR